MTATWKEPLDAVIDILKADHDSVTKKVGTEPTQTM